MTRGNPVQCQLINKVAFSMNFSLTFSMPNNSAPADFYNAQLL